MCLFLTIVSTVAVCNLSQVLHSHEKYYKNNNNNHFFNVGVKRSYVTIKYNEANLSQLMKLLTSRIILHYYHIHLFAPPHLAEPALLFHWTSAGRGAFTIRCSPIHIVILEIFDSLCTQKRLHFKVYNQQCFYRDTRTRKVVDQE